MNQEVNGFSVDCTWYDLYSYTVDGRTCYWDIEHFEWGGVSLIRLIPSDIFTINVQIEPI